MEILLKTYYILLPIIATALIGWVGTMLKDQKKKESAREEENKIKEAEVTANRKANSEGIKLVLRYMLNRYHTEYKLQGKMTYSQYKDWMELFAAYRALNGNSIAMDWNADIEALEKCDHIEGPTTFELMVKSAITTR